MLVDSTDHPCIRCETPLEAGDLRCSICGAAAPLHESTVSKLVVQVLRCTGCGAAIAYDPKHQAPYCSFCGSVVKLETIEDPMEQTEGYLPFQLSRDEARLALKRWLSTLGWFRPSDLSSSAQLEELKPLWWVAWVFDADSLITWTADSNAGSRRSAWAPHSGKNSVRFDNILVSASRGLTSAESAAITPGMNLNSECPEPRGAEQATLEQFDVQRSQARQQLNWAIQNVAAQRIQSQYIPGTRFRNLKVSVVVRKLFTRRLSLPAYVLAYRYKDELHRVVICGQDGRLVVGSAPLSIAKIFAVVGLALAVILLIGTVLAIAQ